jgi:hypothetical protein
MFLNRILLVRFEFLWCEQAWMSFVNVDESIALEKIESITQYIFFLF